MADAEKIWIGPKRIRVLLKPSGEPSLTNAEQRHARRGFLAAWYRLGTKVADHITSMDAVEFSKWSRNELGFTIPYKEETTDKEYFTRLHELELKFLDGWPDVATDDDEDDEE